jgi:hypothetical protein
MKKDGWERLSHAHELVIVSDGSQVGHHVGFAAILLDSEGIMGKFWGFSEVHDASSWVAEWLARLLGVCMVSTLQGKNFA